MKGTSRPLLTPDNSEPERHEHQGEVEDHVKDVIAHQVRVSFARARAFAVAAAVALVLLNCIGSSPLAEAATWMNGDVFAGVGDSGGGGGGTYFVYDNMGNPIDTISQPVGGRTTGCAFSTRPDLYT